MPKASMTDGYQYKGAVKRMSDVSQPSWYWEPQRTNNFEVQIFLDDIIGKVSNAGQGKSTTTDIMLSVANFDAPGMSMSPLEVAYGNNIAKFATEYGYDLYSIEVRDRRQ